MTNDPRPTRRKTLQTLAAAGVPLGLAGCSSLQGDTPEDSDQQSSGDETSDATDSTDGDLPAISFWAKEPSFEDTIRDVVQNYEQGEVDVSIVPQSDLPTELSAARASNTLPNVVQSATKTIQTLGDQGIADIQGANEVIEEIGEDQFLSSALSLFSAGEEGYFSVPHNATVQTLAWRTSKFEEMGLPSEPTSWDELEECAAALHDPANDQFGIGIGSSHHRFTTQCFAPIALSNDARVFSEDGEIVFDSSEMVEAIEFYAKLQSEYGIPGDHDHIPVMNAYLDNQIHLMSFSSYIMGEIADRAGTEMAEDTSAAFQFQHGDRATASGNVIGFTIVNPDSDDTRNASQEFIKYMLEGDAYVRWLHYNPVGLNPLLRSTYDSENYQDHEWVQLWESEIEQMKEALDNQFERFGVVNGQPHPEVGTIQSQLLISEAVSRAIDGENAGDVASEVADKMRDAIA